MNKSNVVDTLDYTNDEELNNLKLDVSYTKLMNPNDTYFTDTNRRPNSRGNNTIVSDTRISTKFKMNKNIIGNSTTDHKINTKNLHSRLILMEDEEFN